MNPPAVGRQVGAGCPTRAAATRSQAAASHRVGGPRRASSGEWRILMIVLLIVSVAGAVVLLFLADRIIKARARVRHRRQMNDRLTAVAERAEKQQEQRQAAVQASAELTSVMPAINRPPLSLPGVAPPAACRSPAISAPAQPSAAPAAWAAGLPAPASGPATVLAATTVLGITVLPVLKGPRTRTGRLRLPSGPPIRPRARGTRPARGRRPPSHGPDRKTAAAAAQARPRARFSCAWPGRPGQGDSYTSHRELCPALPAPDATPLARPTV